MTLDVVGIQTLAKERPDILAVIINENFLPPPQLICAIEAIVNSQVDKKQLEIWLRDLLQHYSSAVRREVARALKIPDETA